MVQETGTNRPSFWDYAVCYGLYLVVLGIAFQVFWVWRATLEVLAGYLIRKSDAYASAYMLSTLFAGLALFIAVLIGEDYLRRGLARRYGESGGYGGLRRVIGRFARLVLPLVAASAIAVALQEWIFLRIGL
jgi:hypothetical protein